MNWSFSRFVSVLLFTNICRLQSRYIRGCFISNVFVFQQILIINHQQSIIVVEQGDANHA